MKTLSDYIDQQLKDPEFAEAWLEGEDEYHAWRALEHAQAEDEPVPQGLRESVEGSIAGAPTCTFRKTGP